MNNEAKITFKVKKQFTKNKFYILCQVRLDKKTKSRGFKINSSEFKKYTFPNFSNEALLQLPDFDIPQLIQKVKQDYCGQIHDDMHAILFDTEKQAQEATELLTSIVLMSELSQ